ncbi:hypothetical protein [Pedobacter helvus]|uniref:Zorya protein ZorC EH domain-containing protein n=1 Tax=Pedobacter helvus TaxID=2563444 RepID=A0ABW9JN36_9SPHI|nr:hypothetical protein [Pedobacter ureilyticus]
MDPRHSDLDKFAPVGSGWDYLITFIKQSVEGGADLTDLEGPYMWLIRSWGNQLPDFDVKELPPAAADAAFLLAASMEKEQKTADTYRNERDLLRISQLGNLPLLFKLTGAAQDVIKELLDAADDPSKPHPRWTNMLFLENVKKHSISGVMADQLCKYFPDLIIKFAKEEWIEEPENPDPDSIGYSFHRQQEQINYFGLNRNIEFDFGFPSGYQTFFYWMFLHHPQKALDFIIPFLNDAFEKNYQANAHKGSDLNKIKVVFSKRQTKEYYACYDYWSAYRGAYARNRVVTSLLMALEKRLLDLADNGTENYDIIRSYLDRLIEEGSNVAFLGVVTSVVQAHPELLNQTSVCLLGVREFYNWESHRATAEFTIRDHYIQDPFLLAERQREDKRPHRQNYTGLVGFVRDYLFYVRDFNKQLFKKLDQLWNKAPEKDWLWRKQLFDMDLRKYKFEPVTEPGYENFVEMGPGYDKKVKQMLAKPDVFDFKGVQDTMWANKVFKFEEVKDKSYETWKAAYERYIAPKADRLMSSPGLLAALGLRDFALEMNKEQLKWCEDTVFQYAEDTLHPKRGGLFDLRTDEKEALFGLTIIPMVNNDALQQKKAKEYIFRLIIRGNNEGARVHIESGLTNYLQQSNPKFVENCWHGVLTYIELKADETAKQRPIWERQMALEEAELGHDWEEQLIRSHR